MELLYTIIVYHLFGLLLCVNERVSGRAGLEIPLTLEYKQHTSSLA